MLFRSFLKLWFERRNIRQELPLEAWLFTIAKNNLLNRIKKLATEWKALKDLKCLSNHSVNDTEDTLQELQYKELLQEAVKTLPEQQRTVFLLARTEHFTYIQIAEKMGISPLTVKTHMSRALNSIKAYFVSNGELFIAVLFLLFV